MRGGVPQWTLGRVAARPLHRSPQGPQSTRWAGSPPSSWSPGGPPRRSTLRGSPQQRYQPIARPRLVWVEVVVLRLLRHDAAWYGRPMTATSTHAEWQAGQVEIPSQAAPAKGRPKGAVAPQDALRAIDPFGAAAPLPSRISRVARY
jgi:hypothetical protein